MTLGTLDTRTTTFVLVPGAGGNATYWYRVVPLLEAAGHRAIAVELAAAAEDAGLNADHWNRRVAA